MKKILIAILGLLLFSCASSKAVKESKKSLDGEWILNNITYSETGIFKIKLLNDAPKDCFEGSTWKFTSNNFKGNYTIHNGSCNPGDRYFMFSILDADADGYQNFMLKPTDEKRRSKTNYGMRFKIIQLSDNAMQLQQTVPVDGNPFKINMNFSKK